VLLLIVVGCSICSGGETPKLLSAAIKPEIAAVVNKTIEEVAFTLTSAGVENKDTLNREVIGIVGSTEKKRHKRQPKLITKDPLNEIAVNKPLAELAPTKATTLLAGTDHSTASNGDGLPSANSFASESQQRRVQRLTSSSPARQLAALTVPNPDSSDTASSTNTPLDSLLRTPTAKKVDLASLEEETANRPTSDVKTVALRPQRSSSVDLLAIPPIEGIASKSRMKAGGASLTSLEAYQQQPVPPIFATDAFRSMAAVVTGSNASLTSTNVSMSYNDSQCTNMDDIIEKDKDGPRTGGPGRSDDLGFNIVVNDENKANENDRILQLRMQEAMAMNRNSSDTPDGGAIMHKFSLWSKAKPAVNPINMKSPMLGASPGAALAPLAIALDNAGTLSNAQENMFAKSKLGVIKSANFADHLLDSKNGRTRGPKAIRAGAVNSNGQSAGADILPAPLPNIFDNDTEKAGTDLLRVGPNESLMEFFDKKESSGDWAPDNTVGRDKQVSGHSSNGTSVTEGVAGLAKSLRSKVVKATVQHGVAAVDSPNHRPTDRKGGQFASKFASKFASANRVATTNATLPVSDTAFPIRREKSESSLDFESYDDNDFEEYVEEEVRDDDDVSVHSIEDDEDGLLSELTDSASLMMSTYPMHPGVQRTRSNGTEEPDRDNVDWSAEKLPSTNALMESPPKPPVDDEDAAGRAQQSIPSKVAVSAPYTHQATPNAQRYNKRTVNSSNAASSKTAPAKRKEAAVKDDGSGQSAKTKKAVVSSKGSASTGKKDKINAFNKTKIGSVAAASEETAFPDERLIAMSSTAPAAIAGLTSPVLSEVSDIEDSSDKRNVTRKKGKSVASSGAGTANSAANASTSQGVSTARETDVNVSSISNLSLQSTRPRGNSNANLDQPTRATSPSEAAMLGQGFAQIGDFEPVPVVEPIKWKRGEQIGEGAFGKVYKGLNEKTGELLAVKQLFVINDGSDKEVNSLRREINLISELRHDNIVRY
jgi:hypothetical protein